MQGCAQHPVEQQIAGGAVSLAAVRHPVLELDRGPPSRACATAAAAMRTRFDCTAPVTSTVSAPLARASPKWNSSWRTLLPPKASPVQSSRLMKRSMPSAAPRFGAGSIGVGAWPRPDPQARVAKMKNGTTHLAYKPEHAVDLDTGAVAAAELHPADKGDTRTIEGTLASAKSHLSDAGGQPSSDAPAECVADKGYHSRAVLKGLDGGPWTSRIAEPRRAAFSRWHGDEEARRAVCNNRARLQSGIGKEAMRKRAEIVERSFAHILDRGGMRRTWLRGRENIHKALLDPCRRA